MGRPAANPTDRSVDLPTGSLTDIGPSIDHLPQSPLDSPHIHHRPASVNGTVLKERSTAREVGPMLQGETWDRYLTARFEDDFRRFGR